MSYILDALKKAEAERDPEARASLAMAQHDRRRNRWLAYAAVIALIANAAILLWLFLPEGHEEVPSAGQLERSSPAEAAERKAKADRSDQPATRGEVPDTAAPTGNAVSARQVPAPTPLPETMPVESATGDTIIGPGTSSAPAPAPVAEPVPASSLPSGQRARFPTLDFSTHVYADDADLRAIVVNGTRLEEGDRLGNLRLHEITEDGAVFRFEDRLVLVSVLDAWN